VGGSLTGRGGDFIIIDDPIKPDDAFSDNARRSNNEWFKTTPLSRLDDKKLSVLILVMQRLHVNDLTGYIENTGFRKLSFPAIALKQETIPIGEGVDHLRHEGEALHDEREDLKILEKIQDQIGPHIFNAQYQQRPEQPEGALLKSKYLQFVDRIPDALGAGHWWISIDSALSTSDTADYSAITVGFSNPKDKRHYAVRSERDRWDYEMLLKKTLWYADRYPRCQFIVEAAGSGIALIHSLMKSGIPVLRYRPTRDKITRVSLALPVFEQKRVVIVGRPGKDPWVEPLVNELLSFPFGRFDDQVDSLVQGVGWAENLVNSGSRFTGC
jgi:predicted phage terminase large subunit-like protein